jgi:hypothetical protein
MGSISQRFHEFRGYHVIIIPGQPEGNGSQGTSSWNHVAQFGTQNMRYWFFLTNRKFVILQLWKIQQDFKNGRR